MESISKVKKKNIPKSVREMSKEMLEETLRKKKVCNAKAQETVEMLCELKIGEAWFLDNLQFINQSHFDDVTVERAILNVCGYPLCDNEIKKVFSQQYHISTKYNKVFDLTERKNFCSSLCYKAALFVKNQLFTSPLWFRDQEVIPKYTLMKSKRKNNSSSTNEKSDASELSKSKFDNLNVSMSEKGSNPAVSECDKNKLVSLKVENLAEVLTNENLESYNNCAAKESIKEKAVESIINNRGQIEILNNSEMKKVESQFNNLTVSERELCRIDSEKKCLPESSNVVSDNILNFNCEKSKSKPDSVTKVETSIFEWFSLDTLFFLFEEKKLQKLFKDKTNQLKEALNAKLSIATYDEKIEKLIKFYSLFENDFSFREDSIKKKLSPLPDYSALQKESKFTEIKVKAFYTGKLELQEPTEEKKVSEEKNSHVENDVCLPLIDSHAQNVLRRKIVLDKLNKVLPDLLKIFSSDYVLQIGQVRKLVSTFILTPHNITFKPMEWTLIGAIMIKFLSLKDKYLAIVLKLEQSQEQLTLLLANFNLKPNYLNDLIDKLTDSESVMKKINEDH